MIQGLREVDIGTGTGAWAVEVADQFPSAVVYGTDLSPIQPQWVPANVEFRVEDITQGLDFNNGSTDLVHSRYDRPIQCSDYRFLHAGITIAQWPIYMKEILRVLKPNDGWVQLMELGYPYVNSENNKLPNDAPASKVCRLKTFKR